MKRGVNLEAGHRTPRGKSCRDLPVCLVWGFAPSGPMSPRTVRTYELTIAGHELLPAIPSATASGRNWSRGLHLDFERGRIKSICQDIWTCWRLCSTTPRPSRSIKIGRESCTEREGIAED